MQKYKGNHYPPSNWVKSFNFVGVRLLGVVETIAEEKRKVFTQMLATENSLITFAVGLRNLSHSTD